MLKQEKPLIVQSLRLSEEEIKAVKKGAKMYGIKANKYKRGAIITQLISDGLLEK